MASNQVLLKDASASTDNKSRDSYKYCIVPQCKSTTKSTPNKVFVTVPKDTKMKDIWQQQMKRVEKISSSSTKYCCEDHFDVTHFKNFSTC